MPLRKLNQQRKLEAEKGPLDEFFAAEPAPGPPKPVISHYVNPFYRLEQEMKKRGFTKAKGPKEHYYEKPVPNETWKERAWLAEPWGQIKTWGAYYSDNPRSSESLGGSSTPDEAIDLLLARIDRSLKSETTEGEPT